MYKELLPLCHDVGKVLIGQNVTIAQTKYNMAQQLLQSDALVMFGTAATIFMPKGNILANESFDQCFMSLTKNVFLACALQI